MIKSEARQVLRFAGRLLWTMVFMLLLSLGDNPCGAQEGPLSLEIAISEAIHNNTLILEAIEKQRAAMENEKSATADLFPKLSAGYTYMHFKETPYVVFGGVDLPISDKDRFAWDVSIAQPLFTGFALVTRRKIAELGIRISDIEKKQAVMDVTRDVKVGYFNILLAKRYLGVSDEAVKQLEGHVADAQQFYDQELIPQNDLLKSQVALAHARQNRVSAKSILNVAVAALNTILKRDITENTTIMEIAPCPSVHYDIAELFDHAMKYRPELKQLETALAQAGLGVKMAQSNYYPKVYLTGRYEQLGDNLRATNNEFGNSYNTIIGAQAQWQFFEWGKTRADVNKATYEMKALNAKIDGIRDSIRLEVMNAYEKLMVAGENIKTAETALIQAKENFRITNLQYQQQVTTSTEVLDAQTFLTQAEMNYYSALYGYMIAKATLVRAIGSNDAYLEATR